MTEPATVVDHGSASRECHHGAGESASDSASDCVVFSYFVLFCKNVNIVGLVELVSEDWRKRRDAAP